MEMVTSKTKLQILLVQIRKDPSMLAAERRGFVQLSGLEDDQFTLLDVFRQTTFPPSILDDYDAMIIGGLSDDPSDQIGISPEVFPFIESLHALIRYAIQIRKPALLSCGGFMIASVTLGGKVVLDKKRAELGVYDLLLTQEAQSDPLFKNFPNHFKAVSGHQKSTLFTPPNCILLASTDRCPIHAFRVRGAPFYAFQFHPEISCEELEARVEGYKDKYFPSDQEYQDFIALMDDTSLANSIVSRFVELVEEHATAR